MIAMLITAAVLLVLVFALLAPLESLRWWSTRSDVAVLDGLARPDADTVAVVREPAPRMYAVYLSGIGAVDGTTDSHRERAVLAELGERLPDLAVSADVFPYAVENRGLTQRATAWFWSRLQRLQRVPVANVASYLINIRNSLRVLVSADPRYGPTFDLAVAHAIAQSLSAQGYDWRAKPPVAIIGYSGGGQIALGASWYVAGLGVPVSVVSLGGVLSDDPALDRVQHVWHFYGERDRMQLLGPALFPGRWRTAPLSAWNRALHAGRLTTRKIGPMKHMNGKDYFDRHATDADGVSFRQLTVDALVGILSE